MTRSTSATTAVAVDAAVGIEQTCRARQAEHPADLPLRRRTRVAARAQPHEGRVVELDGLRRNPLVEEHPQERGGREHVAQRVVGVLEDDASPLADRLEAMIVRERLEQPERVERAGDAGGVVLDAGARERVLEHREVEARVVRDEDGAVEQREQLRRRSRRSAAPTATSSSPMPCTAVASAGIGREGRTRRANLPVSTPSASSRTTRERDDLVHARSRSGRLAVEHGVGRTAAAPPTAGARGPEAHRYRPKRTCTDHVAPVGRSLTTRLTARSRAYRYDVHLLFLDESGQLSERRFFALGGVAVRDRDWHTLRDLWQETLAAHALAGRPRGQVARHPHRRGSARRSRTRSCATIAARPSAATSTLLDIELGATAAPEFFATDEDIYATGLMFLAERFQLLLEGADDVGMIVVDTRFREEDARLRRFFADLTKDGSPYSRLDRIVEGLFLGPSHYSIGLQCADLVCAITAAAERGGGQARGYLKTLLPRFATHPATGALEGVGIKRFPEQVPRPRRPHGCSSREGGLFRRREDRH